MLVFIRDKGSANREKYKINSFIFISEMQPQGRLASCLPHTKDTAKYAIA